MTNESAKKQFEIIKLQLVDMLSKMESFKGKWRILGGSANIPNLRTLSEFLCSLREDKFSTAFQKLSQLE